MKSKNLKSPKKARLRSKSNKFLFEHNGVRFYKPGPKLAKEIDEKADPVISGKVKGVRWMGSMDKTSAAIREKARLIESGKIKTTRWKGSIDKTFGKKMIKKMAHRQRVPKVGKLGEAGFKNGPLKFRKPTAKEHKEIMARFKEMKSGAVKGIEVHPE